MKPIFFGLVTAIFIYKFSGVSALACFECGSCGDPFNKSHVDVKEVHNCIGSCVKSNSTGSMKRGCSNITLITKCEKDGGIEVCVCDTDLCNRSSDRHFLLFGPFIACVIYFLIRYL